MSTDEPAPGGPASADPGTPAAPRGRQVRRVVGRTLVKSWDDDVFSHSAQAAFWQTLSLPPLFLGLLGLLGYVDVWFGPSTAADVQQSIISFSRQVFTPEVVDQIIAPTAADVLTAGRADIVSVGFLLALFAGSSATASLVDSITHAHGQKLVRHPVWQRIVSLLIYVVGLAVAVVTLPLVVLGPELLPQVLPGQWRPAVTSAVAGFYYPATGLVLALVVTALYKVSLPHSLPWRRLLPGALLAMLVFFASASGLRFYILLVTSTGYTYGALATPIAFLLVAFLLGFAIILGAELNNAVDEVWPARPSRRERRLRRLQRMAARPGPGGTGGARAAAVPDVTRHSGAPTPRATDRAAAGPPARHPERG
ncbi:MAG TPA: YihY/virulence factor BrkB family protein [Pseudonocardia sp.]|nr:YihY/virulence factor BrkB family protein [Pseudonocardia sp.]